MTTRHVTDRLLDLHSEPLFPGEETRIREHLEVCAVRAPHSSWLEGFLAEATRQGCRHVSPKRLIELSEETEPIPSTAERIHLQHCSQCREELAWMRSVAVSPEAIDGLRSAPGDSPTFDKRVKLPAPPLSGAETIAPGRVRDLGAWLSRRRRLFLPLGAGAVAAAACLLLVFRNVSDRDLRVAELARIQPLQVQVVRSPGETDEFARLYLEGMKQYKAGDYTAAEAALGDAAHLQPDHGVVFLYLGSARLLLGKPRDAVTALRRAMENTDQQYAQEEATWQLANAYLALGDAHSATEMLQRVIEIRAARRAQATESLRRLAEDARTND